MFILRINARYGSEGDGKYFDGLTQSTHLFELFKKLSDSEKWCKDVLEDEYTEEFLKDMESAEAQKDIEELCELSAKGYIISIYCFSSNYYLNYASVLYNLFLKRRCNVALYSEMEFLN